MQALGPKGLARLHGRIMKLTASENQVSKARDLGMKI